jgi:hypothetical protein
LNFAIERSNRDHMSPACTVGTINQAVMASMTAA